MQPVFGSMLGLQEESAPEYLEDSTGCGGRARTVINALQAIRAECYPGSRRSSHRLTSPEAEEEQQGKAKGAAH
ncbi:MAG: hypothetical protein M3P51_01260 [Chloroflexota bacterium]|nr:hypothetical protein [Chloroflexota bacterium]